MKKYYLPFTLATLAMTNQPVFASTAYGSLSNFDTVNDTGSVCHGFEIELDDIHLKDVGYTYDWNHYGAPKITEDNTDPLHPKVFVRYESSKKPDGTWAAYTAVPVNPIAPTNGHACTNPSVNEGCEHFGVGYYGAPTVVKYHWLVDDGAGNLALGPAVNVGMPSYTYNPPVPANPALNIQAQPAQVVAEIPAPENEIPPGKKFGEPVWVKVIKTSINNANDIALRDLINDDKNGDLLPDWQNAEPSQVETEWKLLQHNNDPNKVVKAALAGQPAALDGSDVDPNKVNVNINRRYEFFNYVADDITVNPNITDGSSRDGETGEAMCDAVDPTNNPASLKYLHGDSSTASVEVTDPNGDPYFINCTKRILVGEFLGSQMAAFDPVAGFGIIDHLQPGLPGQVYMRKVVIGGDAPYSIQVTNGALPEGISFEADPNINAKSTGILKGTPTTAGIYSFGITVTDSQGNSVNTPSNFVLKIGNQNINIPPTANNLLVTVTQNSAVAVNFNGNDADGNPLSYSVDAAPSHGTVIEGIYTPTAGYSGADSFTYKAFDGIDYSVPATVGITVIGSGNHPPVAVNDSAVVNTNTAKTINVKLNDSDIDGNALTVTSVTQPAHGKSSINAANNVVYKPALNYNGADSFTYTVSDGQGGTATASVNVSVSTNHLPVAVADSAITLKNTPVIIPVLANDSDPDNDPLAIAGKALVVNGSVTLNADNTIKFKPAKNFVGTGSFNYTITDGRGGKSTASVTITIHN